MKNMKLTTLVVIAILATLTFEVVEGKCQVACLISMLKCARTADARQEKLGSTDCCDDYFDCMAACGERRASCGSRQMPTQKRGSWNKRYDFEEYNGLPFPLS